MICHLVYLGLFLVRNTHTVQVYGGASGKCTQLVQLACPANNANMKPVVKPTPNIALEFIRSLEFILQEILLEDWQVL